MSRRPKIAAPPQPTGPACIACGAIAGLRPFGPDWHKGLPLAYVCGRCNVTEAIYHTRGMAGVELCAVKVHGEQHAVSVLYPWPADVLPIVTGQRVTAPRAEAPKSPAVPPRASAVAREAPSRSLTPPPIFLPPSHIGRGRPAALLDDVLIVRLADEGQSARQIAKQMGVSHPTIAARLSVLRQGRLIAA